VELVKALQATLIQRCGFKVTRSIISCASKPQLGVRPAAMTIVAAIDTPRPHLPAPPCFEALRR